MVYARNSVTFKGVSAKEIILIHNHQEFKTMYNVFWRKPGEICSTEYFSQREFIKNSGCSKNLYPVCAVISMICNFNCPILILRFQFLWKHSLMLTFLCHKSASTCLIHSKKVSDSKLQLVHMSCTNRVNFCGHPAKSLLNGPDTYLPISRSSLCRGGGGFVTFEFNCIWEWFNERVRQWN